jgi:hypothetical protein
MAFHKMLVLHKTCNVGLIKDDQEAHSEGTVQMIVTRRRVISVEDATAKLDALARRYGIVNPCYEESEADSMSEFDALKWTSLCSQRIALQQRKHEDATCNWPAVPSIFQGIYETKHRTNSKLLENNNEVQNKLAA